MSVIVMEVSKKIVVILCMSLLLVGCVSAFTIKRYSNPSVGFPEPTEQPIKNNCPSEEWNNNFEKFRAGDISKEDMKTYIGGCKW